MLPLLSPPANEHDNVVALETIRNHPHLFALISPINVNKLKSLLTSHPNRVLVASVCHGFCEGFWPWAVTEGVPQPLVVNNSYRPLTDNQHVAFMRAQHDTEIDLGRVSPAFGPDLHPGMTTIPIGIVPKPHSVNLWLVVDHSSGDHSPNSLISRNNVAVPLDNLHDLGAHLLDIHAIHGPDISLVIFKSDVLQAYRRLPMHYLWQLFQIVTIDGL